MSALRVLKILHGCPPDAMGGAGIVAGVQAVALQEHGCKVFIAHPASDGPSAWRGVALHAAHVAGPRGFRGSWDGSPSAVRRMLHLLQPDVVHVHHLSGWPLNLPVIARDWGARVVITLHDYAIPCARGQLVDRDGTVCTGPSTTTCSPCLSPYLGVVARLTGWAPPGDRTMVRTRVERATNALAAAHVRLAPSVDLANRMMRMGVGTVHVEPIPLPQPIAPAPTGAPGPVRFLFCGSIIPTKGLHLLLDAFARLSDHSATLTIAGPQPPYPPDPQYGARLERRARTDPRVQWIGAQHHDAIEALLARHDVLVVPSTWPENSPVIVREATAAGLRTIAPRIGGSRELDPQSLLVDTIGPQPEDSLFAALVTECHEGRKKRSPIEWPTPNASAASLYRRWYPSESRAEPLDTD